MRLSSQRYEELLYFHRNYAMCINNWIFEVRFAKTHFLFKYTRCHFSEARTDIWIQARLLEIFMGYPPVLNSIILCYRQQRILLSLIDSSLWWLLKKYSKRLFINVRSLILSRSRLFYFLWYFSAVNITYEHLSL